MQGLPTFQEIFMILLIRGLPVTLVLTFSGLLIGLTVGVVLALLRVYGGDLFSYFVQAYERVLRGIPLLVLLFLFYVGMPRFFAFAGSNTALSVGIFSLGMRSSAYQSQIFRGAILSVGEGQMEAARAIGMTKLQAIRHIILPQALRIALPGWSNEYAIVIKDSSYCMAIGVIELSKLVITFRARYPELVGLVIMVTALIYFLFTYPVTRTIGQKMTERLETLGLGGGGVHR
ncbi:MAG: amino acid ABC transporter permease [Candidatus Thorarchaeota archaeon]|nr:amino acid ABC transporter permease [Candidatus Thorarchaeota archaeon]